MFFDYIFLGAIMVGAGRYPYKQAGCRREFYLSLLMIEFWFLHPIKGIYKMKWSIYKIKTGKCNDIFYPKVCFYLYKKGL